MIVDSSALLAILFSARAGMPIAVNADSAALAGACAAALIGVTVAVANLGGSSDPILDAAPTWSARPTRATAS